MKYCEKIYKFSHTAAAANQRHRVLIISAHRDLKSYFLNIYSSTFFILPPLSQHPFHELTHNVQNAQSNKYIFFGPVSASLTQNVYEKKIIASRMGPTLTQIRRLSQCSNYMARRKVVAQRLCKRRRAMWGGADGDEKKNFFLFFHK